MESFVQCRLSFITGSTLLVVFWFTVLLHPSKLPVSQKVGLFSQKVKLHMLISSTNKFILFPFLLFWKCLVDLVENNLKLHIQRETTKFNLNLHSFTNKCNFNYQPACLPKFISYYVSLKGSDSWQMQRKGKVMPKWRILDL